MPIDPNIYGQLQQPTPPMNPFQTIGLVQNMRERQQQIQDQQLKNQEVQSVLDDQNAINQAIQQHAKPDGSLDTAGIMAALQQSGRGTAVDKFQTSMLTWNKTLTETMKEKAEALASGIKSVGQMAQGILDDPDPESAYKRFTPIVQALIPPELVQQYWPGQYDQEAITSIRDGAETAAEHTARLAQIATAAHEANADALDKIKAGTERSKVNLDLFNAFKQQIPSAMQLATDQASHDQLLKAYTSLANTISDPNMAQSLIGSIPTQFGAKTKDQELTAGLTAEQLSSRQLEQERLGLEAQGQKDREAQATSLVDSFTDEDYNLMAQEYLQTGQRPTALRNVRSDKTLPVMAKIQHIALQMAPNLSLAQRQMFYKAESGNLANLIKTQSAINAFSSTAEKNLNQFLDTAAKVPDWGSPLLNKGIRSVDKNLLGSPEVAAYNAADAVVTPEFTRLLSSFSGSGSTVLPEGAREDMQSILSGNYTLRQLYSVATILRNDALNRRDAIKDQVNNTMSAFRAQKVLTDKDLQDYLDAHPGSTREQALKVMSDKGYTYVGR
jgi:hypothetical protein